MDDFVKLNEELCNNSPELQKLYQQYQRALKSVVNEINEITIKYNGIMPKSMAFRQGQLLSIRRKLQEQMYKLGSNTVDIATQRVGNGVKDGYYKTAYEINNQLDYGTTWSALNPDIVKTVLTDKIEGSTFSNRIWENTTKLAVRMDADVRKAVINGDSTEKLSIKLAKEFNTSFYNASRVINTETARAVNKGQLEAYKQSGVVNKVMWDATLEDNTCVHCQSMDGKQFDIDEAPYLPLHPCCRCCLVPVVDEWKPTHKLDNDTKEVIEYKNYNEWYNQNIKDDTDDIIDDIIDEEATKLKSKRNYNNEIAKAFAKQRYDDAHNLIDSCPDERIIKLWDWAENQIKVGGTRTKRAYCRRDTIYIDVGTVASGDSIDTPFQTLFHESGHAIDSLLGVKSGKPSTSMFRSPHISTIYTDADGKSFGDVIREEIKEYCNAQHKLFKAEFEQHKKANDIDWLVNNGYIYSSYRSNYESGLVSVDRLKHTTADTYSRISYQLKKHDKLFRGDLSDIFEGATKAKVQAGIGHGASYWRDADALPIEAFAEFIDSRVASPESFKLLQQYLPKSTAFFDKMLDDIVNNMI